MEPVNETAAENQLTFGEQVVGKTFNPSGDDKVARLKALGAEMIDIVNEHKVNSPDTTYIDNLLKGDAFRQILHGQMAAVKYITNKH